MTTPGENWVTVETHNHSLLENLAERELIVDPTPIDELALHLRPAFDPPTQATSSASSGAYSSLAIARSSRWR